jgi:hypothetical protein
MMTDATDKIGFNDGEAWSRLDGFCRKTGLDDFAIQQRDRLTCPEADVNYPPALLLQPEARQREVQR